MWFALSTSFHSTAAGYILLYNDKIMENQDTTRWCSNHFELLANSQENIHPNPYLNNQIQEYQGKDLI